MLEVRHLRTLIALAEAGTVSRAAERVHLTQSALSHQLKALESHYGLAMVKRHGQSVQLTEPGRRLVALGRTVMSEIQAAEQLRRAGRAGERRGTRPLFASPRDARPALVPQATQRLVARACG